jgi:biotin transporter BioY
MENKNLILIDVISPKIESEKLTLLKNIVLVLGFAVLTGISAKIKIEIGPVPITMQTLIVLLSGALLGSKRGVLSQIIYLFLGLAGIPWFSRGGGMTYIFSPTFGYIIGFILAAFFVGFLSEKGFDRKIEKAISAMLLSNILIYLPGLLWLTKFVGFERVLAVGFYPFIVGDLIKIFLAGLILPSAWKIFEK